MLYHHLFSQFARQNEVKAALIGGGNYGTAIVTQSLYNRYLTVSAVADQNIESARNAYRAAGIPEHDICECATIREAKAVMARGQYIVTADTGLIFKLGIDVVADATGNPEAGAYHAMMALEHGRHMVMITKETDSVVGPLLHKLFKEKGLVYSPVDGDQPAIAMQLVEWARLIGLEIICAGKARDGEFIYDPENRTVMHPADAKKGIPEPVVVEVSPEDARYLDFIPAGCAEEYVQKRHEILRGLPQTAGFDYCETVMMANATGLVPDQALLHKATLRVNELPIAYCSRENGGVLRGDGRIDLFTCIRRRDEASMGGGVFLVVRSPNAYSQMILTSKGLVGNYDNSAAVICHPYHLCGVESSTSLLAAAMLGLDTGSGRYRQRYDLVRRAAQDLPAGTVCGNDKDPRFDSFIIAATKNIPSDPAPAHLLNGNKLKVDVAAGEIITYDMVEKPGQSVLWDLRAQLECL